MSQTISNFDALEKQLAKDALEKALKDLHNEIARGIDKNRRSFADEIAKSLANLNETIETHISNEINRKLPIFLERNFSNMSTQMKSTFKETFSPAVSKVEQNMKNLESQGEKTLQSWDKMIKAYESFWTTPFFFMIFASVLIGIAVSLCSSYYTTRSDRALRQNHEELLSWYATEYLKLKEAQTSSPFTQSAEIDKTKEAKQSRLRK